MPVQQIHSHAHPAEAPRNLWQALTRGWRSRCPECGEGKLFGAYLKPVHSCSNCGGEMHHHRADDLPPYLVIFVVGHVVLAGYLMVEAYLLWNSWQHLALWVPITLVLTLAMIQPVKGAVIGLQWANRMHGFGGSEEPGIDALGGN